LLVVVNATRLQTCILLNNQLLILQVVAMTFAVKGFTLHKMSWHLAK